MLKINRDTERATRGLAKSGTVGAVRFHRAGKERAGMTNFLMVIVIRVLLDIDGRLIKMNERQGKEDAGNND